MMVLIQLHFLSDAMHLGHAKGHGFLTLLSTPDAVFELLFIPFSSTLSSYSLQLPNRRYWSAVAGPTMLFSYSDIDLNLPIHCD